MKFLNRVLVSIVFAPLTLLFVYLGGVYLQLFLGLLVFLMLQELWQNYNKKGVIIPISMQIFGVLLYIAALSGHDFLGLAALFIAFIVISSTEIFGKKSEHSIQRIATSVFSMFYVSYFLVMVYRLRAMPNGRMIVIGLIVMIWLTDTAAYLTGMLLGKRSGIISISPKKTLEGFVGGMVFSALGSWLWVYLIGLDNSYIWMLALASGIIGQYGDLFESLLKRDLGIKDSSRILGEHGGILDRFDSLLFAAPFLYILIKLTGSS